MSERTKTRVVILGGGFAGLYTALELERSLARNPNVEVTLVNSENFFLFTPMLHEVAASDLDMTHIVNPIRRALRIVSFFSGAATGIDLEKRVVTVSHGLEETHEHELPYDHLVLGLGSVTNFFGVPGLEESAVTMRTLGDAIELRNRLIAQLEEADFECSVKPRPFLLTAVVAGGGFAGVETVAGINDFLRESVKFYPHLSEKDLRVVLVHAGEVILPELDESLGRYAQKRLSERGVEIRTGAKLESFDGTLARLSGGEEIAAHTVVWAAGTAPNPLIDSLPCKKERGRVVVDECMQAPDWPGVWAAGDCAVVPNPKTGRPHPPTAQHALRQGRLLGRNIKACVRGRKPKPFRFETLGQLAAIGKRTGVGNIFGVNFSGFFAWWLWRTVYLAKLPGLDRKIRVAMDWTLDLIFPKDLAQFPAVRSRKAPETQKSPEAAAGVSQQGKEE